MEWYLFKLKEINGNFDEEKKKKQIYSHVCFFFSLYSFCLCFSSTNAKCQPNISRLPIQKERKKIFLISLPFNEYMVISEDIAKWN